MSEARVFVASAAVPVLTEVLELPVLQELAAVPESAQPNGPADEPPLPLDETALTNQILADLRLRVDSMLTYRLREALVPVLARVADEMVEKASAELADTLRDVVARAVAQELARLRVRG